MTSWLTMLKQIAIICVLIFSLTLGGCVTATAGLKVFSDSLDGYSFLYPNGWVEVAVNNGPDVVFHDLIESTENISVVISDVPQGKTLADLGSPSEVGYRLSKGALAQMLKGSSGSDQTGEVELINASARESGTQTYYILEYALKLPDRARHNLVSVAIGRGKLLTLSISTTEKRWPKMAQIFAKAVNSFIVE